MYISIHFIFSVILLLVKNWSFIECHYFFFFSMSHHHPKRSQKEDASELKWKEVEEKPLTTPERKENDLVVRISKKRLQSVIGKIKTQDPIKKKKPKKRSKSSIRNQDLQKSEVGLFAIHQSIDFLFSLKTNVVLSSDMIKMNINKDTTYAEIKKFMINNKVKPLKWTFFGIPNNPEDALAGRMAETRVSQRRILQTTSQSAV